MPSSFFPYTETGMRGSPRGQIFKKPSVGPDRKLAARNSFTKVYPRDYIHPGKSGRGQGEKEYAGSIPAYSAGRSPLRS